MYKIAGHTMGTPEYTVPEAIELFHRIGLDGAEIVIQDDYKSGLPTDCPQELLAQVRDCAELNHIQIIALTPYNSRFNSLNEEVRFSEIRAIERVIDYCEFFGANISAFTAAILPPERRMIAGKRSTRSWLNP